MFISNEVKRDKDGKAEGVVSQCKCGWVSRPCFSSMVASVEKMNHQEKSRDERCG